MSQVTSKLTLALAGLTLASLPVLAVAQAPAIPRTTQQAAPTSQQTRPKAVSQSSPQHHLDEAKTVLGTIRSEAPAIVELRRHFAQLEEAWRVKIASAARAGAASAGHAGGHRGGTTSSATGSTTSGTPEATAAGTSGTPEQAGASGLPTRATPQTKEAGNWMAHYQAIDGLLDRLLGEGAAASADVDAMTRTRLADVRRHIDQFHERAIAK